MTDKPNAYVLADLPEIQEINGAANTLRYQHDTIDHLQTRIEELEGIIASAFHEDRPPAETDTLLELYKRWSDTYTTRSAVLSDPTVGVEDD